MAFATVQSWSETPASNTEIDGVNIDEGCNPSGINNAIRELMAQVAAWTGDDTIASATTTDLSTVNGQFVSITGTTTITGFGTVKAGWVKFLHFAGALTLTHNATSMILPGGNNITTVAGDTAAFVSLGSGNWRCLVPPGYISLSTANTWTANQTFSSTDAGNTGPQVILYHNSASPAASDVAGYVVFNGNDSGGSSHTYGRIAAVVSDPTNGSEDGQLVLQVSIAGSVTNVLTAGSSITMGVPVLVPDGTVSAPAIAPSGDTNTGIYALSADSLGFTMGGTHVAHLNSTGWTVSNTSGATTFGSVNAVKNLISGGGQIDVTNTTGGAAMRLSRASGTDGTVASFHYQTTSVGTISVTGSATAYNTSSDGRLKENLGDFDAGSIIDAIEIYEYNWIADGTVGYGPIAQELHAVFPQAVQPGSSGDAPGDETFEAWTYDASKLVPVLIKEIQSMRARLSAAGL